MSRFSWRYPRVARVAAALFLAAFFAAVVVAAVFFAAVFFVAVFFVAVVVAAAFFVAAVFVAAFFVAAFFAAVVVAAAFFVAAVLAAAVFAAAVFVAAVFVAAFFVAAVFVAAVFAAAFFAPVRVGAAALFDSRFDDVAALRAPTFFGVRARAADVSSCDAAGIDPGTIPGRPASILRRSGTVPAITTVTSSPRRNTLRALRGGGSDINLSGT